MGLFKRVKKAIEDAGETEVSKLEFKRYDGFAGSVVQRFADNSVPVCPICGNNPHWLLHQSQKVVKIFPVAIQDNYYFLKCDSCGMVMHTVYQQVGDRSAPFLANPSPRDNVTMMTFDVLGDKAENFDLAGKEMSIWEINQMAENNKK